MVVLLAAFVAAAPSVISAVGLLRRRGLRQSGRQPQNAVSASMLLPLPIVLLLLLLLLLLH